MGAWSTSVTGNDTAADLKDEYTCAFYRYPQEEALQKIEAYVRGMFDESDLEEWCAYVYSLADFMWKKGILTDAVRARALQMIDSGFGLELWAESGEKVLRDRKKALEKFRAQITAPMGAVKKIKPNVHTEDIFTAGDLIAIKLMTAGKTYGTKHAASDRRMTEEAFQSYDGKYILLQKAWSHVSWHSALVPEIGDHWAVFRLFVDHQVCNIKENRYKEFIELIESLGLGHVNTPLDMTTLSNITQDIYRYPFTKWELKIPRDASSRWMTAYTRMYQIADKLNKILIAKGF